jgi:hypothetical protein
MDGSILIQGATMLQLLKRRGIQFHEEDLTLPFQLKKGMIIEYDYCQF